ncbi:hypothetical protein [Bradyrhizobium sp. RDM4]|uniref:hypothetical protein n=1 Tax=Bradyrhizobium sp. RDM4 TaxID=3378765 RepID=UPI0038FC62DF
MTSDFILFERRLAQPENQRRWTLCQIVQQFAGLALIKDLLVPRRHPRHLRIGAPVLDGAEHRHFARAKTC